jgi:hypothetical protein
LSYFKFRRRELETLKLVCNNFYQLGTYATFGNSCNINACDVKYDGNCISGLAFMRGTLFDPAFGGLSGGYPQAKGLHHLKYVGALERRLAYLSWCNSGWFCHKYGMDLPSRVSEQMFRVSGHFFGVSN